MDIIASILRHLAPAKGDVAAVGIGVAAPFLAGAVPVDHGLDLQAMITAAIIAAASAASAAAVKGIVAAIGAFIRGDVRAKRLDDDPKNDKFADAEEAFADKIDPDGKAQPCPPSPSTGIARGPQP